MCAIDCCGAGVGKSSSNKLVGRYGACLCKELLSEITKILVQDLEFYIEERL